MTNIITGRTFGMLSVTPAVLRRNGKLFAVCVCKCGTEKAIRKDHLLSGSVVSCGCYNSQRQREIHTIHGNCTNSSSSGTYMSWQSMLNRCTNRNSRMYSKYGAVGISVCDEWRNFERFLMDMQERPKGTSLDRIDGSKGYSPDNCRWATPTEQIRNRCNTLSINGEYFAEIASRTGQTYDMVYRKNRSACSIGAPMTRNHIPVE